MIRRIYLPTDRQLAALRLRAEPMSFEDVGNRLGVVRERAQQMTRTAIKRLKEMPEGETHPDWPLVEVVSKLVLVKSKK